MGSLRHGQRRWRLLDSGAARGTGTGEGNIDGPLTNRLRAPVRHRFN